MFTVQDSPLTWCGLLPSFVLFLSPGSVDTLTYVPHVPCVVLSVFVGNFLVAIYICICY